MCNSIQQQGGASLWLCCHASCLDVCIYIPCCVQAASTTAERRALAAEGLGACGELLELSLQAHVLLTQLNRLTEDRIDEVGRCLVVCLVHVFACLWQKQLCTHACSGYCFFCKVVAEAIRRALMQHFAFPASGGGRGRQGRRSLGTASSTSEVIRTCHANMWVGRWWGTFVCSLHLACFVR